MMCRTTKTLWQESTELGPSIGSFVDSPHVEPLLPANRSFTFSIAFIGRNLISLVCEYLFICLNASYLMVIFLREFFRLFKKAVRLPY